MNTNMKMANILRELRIQHNFTQEDVAEKLNVSSQAVSRWETEKTEPSIDVLKEIAKLYDVTVDELFGIRKENEIMHIEIRGYIHFI